MVTRKTFYWTVIPLLAVFLLSVLYVHYSRQSEIELLQGQLKAQTLQVGIWQTECRVAKDRVIELEIENRQLYDGIEASTLLMDYAYGLIGAQKTYIETVQGVMRANNIIYPIFVYKDLKQ
jgi:hypothetical protein